MRISVVLERDTKIQCVGPGCLSCEADTVWICGVSKALCFERLFPGAFRGWSLVGGSRLAGAGL